MRQERCVWIGERSSSRRSTWTKTWRVDKFGHEADLESATGEGYVAPKKDELKIIMAGRVLEDGQTVRGEPTTSNEDHERGTIPSKDR